MRATLLRVIGVLCIAGILSLSSSAADGRPGLFLTVNDVQVMREALGKYPVFDKAIADAKARMANAFAKPLRVPIPKDASGPTHERHRQNYLEMQLAGTLYCITGESRYADFVRDMLLEYSRLYPTLGRHPAAVGEAAGRLFWQTLNETVWLVHASQAYDCVMDRIDPAQRKTIENNVLRPMAKFLSEEHAEEMDRIHNHGTWTCAAVGMVGYLLNDRELIEKSLYSSKKDRSGGFIRQLDLLFSPDGFYSEGPYYARYALVPFYTFAQVIENNQPDLKVFEYRDRILQKALYSALQLSSGKGEFLPFNDAMKEMSYLSPDIVTSLDIAYERYHNDPTLLPVAKQQNTVLLNAAGVTVAKALSSGKVPSEFSFKSVEYVDGANGDEGGVGILRSDSDPNHSLLFMKYGAHGLSHGHYDKLTIMYYDRGNEILQDYGSARFVNTEAKYGGRYLPENKSFAMQTIAHNTVTVDQRSQFDGKISVSEKHHGDRNYFSTEDPAFQYMSARLADAYPGVRMQRSVAMMKDAAFARPLIFDVIRIDAEKQHVYDLPFYYQGQFMTTNARVKANDKQVTTFGAANGYQHLWNEAEGKCESSLQVTWLRGDQFYTLTTVVDSSTEAYFVRIGAGDPNFNLRSERGVVIRQRGASHVFASVIEPHGRWDGVTELSRDGRGSVENVRVIATSEEATAIRMTAPGKGSWTLLLSNTATPGKQHRLLAGGRTYQWTGNAQLLREK